MTKIKVKKVKVDKVGLLGAISLASFGAMIFMLLVVLTHATQETQCEQDNKMLLSMLMDEREKNSFNPYVACDKVGSCKVDLGKISVDVNKAMYDYCNPINEFYRDTSLKEACKICWSYDYCDANKVEEKYYIS